MQGLIRIMERRAFAGGKNDVALSTPRTVNGYCMEIVLTRGGDTYCCSVVYDPRVTRHDIAQKHARELANLLEKFN